MILVNGKFTTLPPNKFPQHLNYASIDEINSMFKVVEEIINMYLDILIKKRIVMANKLKLDTIVNLDNMVEVINENISKINNVLGHLENNKAFLSNSDELKSLEILKFKTLFMEGGVKVDEKEITISLGKDKDITITADKVITKNGELDI